MEECKRKNFLMYIHYIYWLIGGGGKQQRMTAPLVEKEP